jgi:hypothetical protein
MRFVRAFTDTTTGDLSHVRTNDAPFDESDPPIHVLVPAQGGGLVRVEFEAHELGVAEHFLPTNLAGVKCSPAAHLLQRMERRVDAPDDGALFRVKSGREPEVPTFHSVPTTVGKCFMVYLPAGV